MKPGTVQKPGVPHCPRFAAAGGRIFAEDGFDPAIAEGAGTIARELGHAGALGDANLVALVNGSLVNGVGAWVKAHRPATRVVAVGEADILAAMRLVFRTLDLVGEPAGAAGLAALLADADLCRGPRVSTILCGGNLTVEQARMWLPEPP